MKTILIIALLCVAAQAKHHRSHHQKAASHIDHPSVHGVLQVVDEVEGAPKYPAPRVISGIQATRGQFPYQVALYLNGRSFCGGSLISTRWVLTAAHCASGISTFTVYLGAQNLNAANEEGRVIIETTSKIVHPNYSSILISNDVAVVNLNQDVQLNTSNAVSPQLNYVDLTIISNSVCAQTFGALLIRSSNICTQGVGERGVCNAKLHRSQDLRAPRIDHSSVASVQQTVDVVTSAPKYPVPRVISGIQASRGQFPYQVALYLNGRSFCGGSLISTRWVLTAAHCASGISTFTVYLGAQNLNNANEEGRVIIETTSKIVHPSYSVILIANDIALINLNQDVQLNKSTAVSPQLNYVDLAIISNDLCRQTFGTYIRSSNICTQGLGDRGVCNGDSGGPLVDLGSGLQIGVTSFVSSDGCQSGNPNGFVRVSSFASWIADNTGLAL
ncbi:Chymotrypsin [Gryllus bimaculatus]|nr:Chymotrypsin [Gryllus bimaculatus]